MEEVDSCPGTLAKPFQIVLDLNWTMNGEPLKQQYEVITVPIKVFAPKNNWNRLKKWLGFKYEKVVTGYMYDIELK